MALILMQVLLHPSDQPIFRLELRAAQCRLEVRVNDVPIFRDLVGWALRAEFPLNEWLFQGSNALSVIVSPLEDGGAFGQEASVEMILWHKFARDAVRNAVEIGVLKWQSPPVAAYEHVHDAVPSSEAALTLDEDDDAPLLALPGQEEDLRWRIHPAQKRETYVRIDSAMALPPPWPVCPWSRGQVLADDGRTLFSIQGMVRAFHLRLMQGGYDDFLLQRRAVLESAYYLQGMEVDEALAFPILLKNKDWRLQPLPEQGMLLELAGGGKLARLLTGGSLESPLQWVHEKDRVAAVVDAWWMFNGEWVMIR